MSTITTNPTPYSVKAPALPSAKQFLADNFGERAGDVRIGGFHGDPGTPPPGAWVCFKAGKAASGWLNLDAATTDEPYTHLDALTEPDAKGAPPNLYFCPFLMKGPRSSANFESAVLIPVDDVGARAHVEAEKARIVAEHAAWRAAHDAWEVVGGPEPAKPAGVAVKIAREDMLAMLGRPTLAMVTSTSRGIRNEQWFYRLNTPCTDGAKVLALLRATGSDAKDLARWVRLPGGANGKAGQIAEHGAPFVSQLGETGYDPSRVFDIDEMLARARVDAAAVAAAAPRVVKLDPTAGEALEFRALAEAGLVLDPVGQGEATARAYWMLCPGAFQSEAEGGWLGETEGHTPGSNDQAKVWDNGGFQCHHSHCEAKTFNDLAQWVDRHADAGPILRRLQREHARRVFGDAPDEYDIAQYSSAGMRELAAGLTAALGAGAMAFERRAIKVRKGEVHIMTDEALRRLKERGRVFQRAGQPVHIKRVPIKSALGALTLPRIVTVKHAAMIEELSAAARWTLERHDKKTGERIVVDCDPPEIVARVLVDKLLEADDHLDILSGTINAPFLRSDGTVAQADGEARYDEETGLWIDPCGVAFRPVRDAECTRADALAALDVLAEPLSGYVFDSPVSRGVALSSLLLPFARPGITLAPGIAIDAPLKGSGKTKLATLPAILATGEAPALIAPSSARSEELDKQLNAALLGGASTVVLDNIVGDGWGTNTLCAALTAELLKVRPLGSSDARDIPNKAMVIVTGNNLTFPGDTTRRFLVCRIDPEVERPETRPFSFDPVVQVKRNRARYVHAALTILRAYVLAGSPQQRGRPLGSFEEFAARVRDALMWLGLPDIAEGTDAALAATGPEQTELADVLAAWQNHPVLGRGEYTAKQLVERVMDGGALANAFSAVCGGRLDPLTLGQWLAKHKGQPVGEVRFTGQKDRKGYTCWRLDRTTADKLAVHSSPKVSKVKQTEEFAGAEIDPVCRGHAEVPYSCTSAP